MWMHDFSQMLVVQTSPFPNCIAEAEVHAWSHGTEEKDKTVNKPKGNFSKISTVGEV